MSDYKYYKKKLYHENGIYLTRKRIGKFPYFYGEFLYVAYWGKQGVILDYNCNISLDDLVKEMLENASK